MKWTDDEIKLLNEVGSRFPRWKLKTFFPNRSISSIEHKRMRLGIYKSPSYKITQSEETKEKKRLRKGEKRSFEAKQQMKKACIGRKPSKEMIEGQKLMLKNNHPFKNKHHTQESKDKMSKSHIGKNKGANNPRWKGGTSVLEFEKTFGMSKGEWLKLVKIVRQRDKYICQYCGKHNAFDVHHIIPRSVKIDNTLNNLITLCKSCHPKVEILTQKYLDENKNPIEILYEVWSR